MPAKEWEVYDLDNGDAEDVLIVKEWSADDAAKSASEQMDMQKGSWSKSRNVMVRKKPWYGEPQDGWQKFVVTTELHVKYSANEADDE